MQIDQPPAKRQKTDKYSNNGVEGSHSYNGFGNLHSSSNGFIQNNHAILMTPMNDYTTQDVEIKSLLSEQSGVRKCEDLTKIEEIIKEKQKELEQLKQMKEQRLLQSQVNKVSIHRSTFNSQQQSDESSSGLKREFLRAPRFYMQDRSGSATAQQFQNNSGSGNGLKYFDQPMIRSQNNSNLNNSFDVSGSRQQHEFSIPLMIPKRVQQINSSQQTKCTIDSFIEEPMPFRTHLNISNFNLQQQQQNHLQEIQVADNIEQNQLIQQNELQVPDFKTLCRLRLPKLAQKDINYIISDILNLEMNENEVIVSFRDDQSKLKRKDLRKLCLENQNKIDSIIQESYVQLLSKVIEDFKFSEKVKIFTQKQFNVNQQEWLIFMENLCYKTEYKSQNYIFICCSDQTQDMMSKNNQGVIIYHLDENLILKIIRFENQIISFRNDLSSDRQSSQDYTNKLLELQRNLYFVKNNVFDENQQDMQIIDNGISQIQEEFIQVQGTSEDIQGNNLVLQLTFLYYLRYLVQNLTIGEQITQKSQWETIEMIIKNENFNEFLRYGIAMELIKKEMLI